MLHPELMQFGLQSDYNTLRDLMQKTGYMPDKESLVDALMSLQSDIKLAKGSDASTKASRPWDIESWKRSSEARRRLGLYPKGSRTHQKHDLSDPEKPLKITATPGSTRGADALSKAISNEIAQSRQGLGGTRISQGHEVVKDLAENYEKKKRSNPERVINDILQRYASTEYDWHDPEQRDFRVIPRGVMQERSRYREAKLNDILGKLDDADLTALEGEELGSFLDTLFAMTGRRYTGEY